MAKDFELADGELEVLKVLWDHGPLPVRAVLSALHERGRQVAYTTVQTVLTRLEQKGVVKSDKRDMAFVYRPLLSRDRVSRSRLSALAEQLYDGAVGPLVLHLIKSQRLTPAEMVELQRLIDKLDADGK